MVPVTPADNVVRLIVPPDSTSMLAPLEKTFPKDRAAPEPISIVPPLRIVSDNGFAEPTNSILPPLATARAPPLRIVNNEALAPNAPSSIVPPLETVVLVAEPPSAIYWKPPLLTVVTIAVPSTRSSMPPLLNVVDDAVPSNPTLTTAPTEST